MKHHWTYEEVAKDAKKYQTKTEWRQTNYNYYQAARLHNWLPEVTQHMHPAKHIWTYDELIQESKKYPTRNEWRFNGWASYWAAQRRGLIEELSAHMPKQHEWTKEEVIAAAQPYKTKNSWKRSNFPSYQAAVKHKWIKAATQHMHPAYLSWTKEQIIEDAKKFSCRIEWCQKGNKSYAAALRKGWVAEIMPCLKNESTGEKTLFAAIHNLYPSAQKKRFGKIQRGTYGQQFELDIYIPELQKGVEFNGDYWHSFEALRKSRPKWPEEMIKNYHQIKRQFFADRDIHYVEITESEWLTNKEAAIAKALNFLANPTQKP